MFVVFVFVGGTNVHAIDCSLPASPCNCPNCTGCSNAASLTPPECTCTGCLVPTASFLPGTLVKTLIGDKKIEDIKAGDEVLSFKDETIGYSKVIRIFKYPKPYYYTLEAGKYMVKVTYNHPFYIGSNQFKIVEELKIGDTVYVLENGQLTAKEITQKTRVDRESYVYNMTVDNTNTYFAAGFAVHNKGREADKVYGPSCGAGYVVDYTQPIDSMCGLPTKDVVYIPGNAQREEGCCQTGGGKRTCGDWYNCPTRNNPDKMCRDCEETPEFCAKSTWTTYACKATCDPNDWGVWGACSASCGPGTQTRTNACGTGQTQACTVNDPNVWTAWSTCTVNCGTGTQSRTNQCGTPQTQNCNTSACGPWIKLKDSSFISAKNLFNMISLVPDPYDADDTTEQYFIVGVAGIVAAPAISINISNINPTAKTGNPEYKAIYTPAYSMTPALFLSYIKARKEYKVITDLGEITGSGIYVYNGDISIDSDSSPFNTAGNIVLISTGTVTVIRVAPATVFTPVGTAAIIAPTINFSSNLTEATGIFIGNTISTGTNATQGLKIVGNLIAQTSLVNNRKWAATGKPSLFIKFDQTKYINLLPYLSTADYQWREVQ